MKLLIFSILVIGCVAHILGKEVKDDTSKITDKKTDKRGAVEIQTSNSAYITPSPGLLAVSHGPSAVPVATVSPGIVYAPQKQIIATASPSQLYAKPSPNLPKISDAVLNGQAPLYQGLVASQVYQQQELQPLAKLAYNSPSYAVSAPIPSHLAYSKHQILPQQQLYQPQVALQQHYSYPQAQLYQPQVNVNYLHAQPQVNHYQAQLLHAQPQATYLQPQVYPQAQLYHQQPIQHQVAYTPAVVAQPIAKVTYAQAPVIAQQVYATQQASKGEGAISYASFSQGNGGSVQYAAKVAPQVAIVAKQAVPQVYQQQYYQHGQQYQQAYVPQAQVYTHSQPQQLLVQQVQQPQIYHAQPQQLYQHQQVYQAQPQQVYHTQPQQLYQHQQVYQAQPQQVYQAQAAKVAYSQPQATTQYFGKAAQVNANGYSGYNH